MSVLESQLVLLPSLLVVICGLFFLVATDLEKFVRDSKLDENDLQRALLERSRRERDRSQAS